jgi:glycosyltransferase involved in cell wall biosynthesis
MQSGDQGGAPGEATALLHVFPSFSYGGQQARLAGLARGMGPEFRHHIVALDGDLAARALFGEGAPVSFSAMTMKKSAGLSVSNIWRLRRIITDARAGLLCTYNWGSIEAALANRLGPRIPHIHFEDGFGADETNDLQARRRALARRLFLRSAVIVVPSRALESVVRFQWKLGEVRRIDNGIDFDLLQGGRRSHSDAVVVGSVGALRPEKNYERLISAFLAADRDGCARLEIVGAGPERARLAAALQGDARVSLPGATASPADAYAHFDIFALSSDTEQAPLSVMEAMAAGLPIVATNVGDIAEMVSDENRPFVTPLGDDEAYAHALAQLLQNAGARAAIGGANRRRAKEAFSFDRMVAAHGDLYRLTARRHG